MKIAKSPILKINQMFGKRLIILDMGELRHFSKKAVEFGIVDDLRIKYRKIALRIQNCMAIPEYCF